MQGFYHPPTWWNWGWLSLGSHNWWHTQPLFMVVVHIPLQYPSACPWGSVAVSTHGIWWTRHAPRVSQAVSMSPCLWIETIQTNFVGRSGRIASAEVVGSHWGYGIYVYGCFLGPLPTIFGAAATAKTLLQTKHIPDIPDLQFWFSNVKGALYRPKDLTEIVPKCTRQNRSSSVPVDFGSIQYLFQVRSYGIKWCANLEVKP